jgi:hypothetical protein
VDEPDVEEEEKEKKEEEKKEEDDFKYEYESKDIVVDEKTL